MSSPVALYVGHTRPGGMPATLRRLVDRMMPALVQAWRMVRDANAAPELDVVLVAMIDGDRLSVEVFERGVLLVALADEGPWLSDAEQTIARPAIDTLRNAPVRMVDELAPEHIRDAAWLVIINMRKDEVHDVLCLSWPAQLAGGGTA